MKLPNLFIIGWPKTGSTSLDYYLSQHPDIYIAPHKESYHFAYDILEESQKIGTLNKFPYSSNEKYQSLFNGVTSEKYVGESSVFYIVSDVALQNIKQVSPDAKIIVIIRHPIEILESWFHYLKFHSREDLENIYDALEQEENRKNLQNLPLNTTAPIHLQYKEIINLKKHYNKLFDIFDVENVHIVFYDDIKDDERTVVKNIFNFLQVDSTFQPDFTHKNVSAQIKNAKLKYFIDTNKGYLVALLKKLGLMKSNKGLHKLYLKVFAKDEKRDDLEKEQSQELFTIFKDQIEYYQSLRKLYQK